MYTNTATAYHPPPPPSEHQAYLMWENVLHMYRIPCPWYADMCVCLDRRDSKSQTETERSVRRGTELSIRNIKIPVEIASKLQRIHADDNWLVYQQY